MKRIPREYQPRHFDERLRYPVPEAAQLLRQSEPKTWVDISRGKIRVLKDGGRTYVPGSEILRLSTLSAAQAVA
jgi:hypothetical protein